MEDIRKWNLVDLAESQDYVFQEQSPREAFRAEAGMFFLLEVYRLHQERRVESEFKALELGFQGCCIGYFQGNLFHLLVGERVLPDPSVVESEHSC